ncbi:hypothetical protein [Flavobacterium hibisci]|uniref:hypothetical protein n=1 Tax=Flavobacterium hibisci TaxID=1914462 RepID=UPI001CBF5777|nr:hypothetical protein [Flavobacterium hibisci]MBZ4042614.1 hypothetical protein [Flavobacterium hibisci]
MKNLLSKVNNDVSEEFDPLFLEILTKAFKIRYYDNLREPIFIGFYLNQFIGELDWTGLFTFWKILLERLKAADNLYQAIVKPLKIMIRIFTKITLF